MGTTTEPASFFPIFPFVPDFRAYKRLGEGALAETIGGDREDDIDRLRIVTLCDRDWLPNCDFKKCFFRQNATLRPN